jgi:hypothetical protein
MRGADPWARLLFIAMWNWADDCGRGTANNRELAAFAFPDEEDPIAPTAAELPSLLTEVRGRWGVIFYEVGGRRFYAIPTWDVHQRNERRAKSRHPGPEEGTEYDPDPSDQPKLNGQRRFTEVPSHRVGSSVAVRGSSVPGTGEQGNRGTGEQGRKTPPLAPLAEQDQFAVFYDTYPRKMKPREAEKAWTAALRRGVAPDYLISRAQAFADNTRGQDKKFLPYPASWLNGGDYENELEPEHLRIAPVDQNIRDLQSLKARFPADNVWQLPGGSAS